jgi:hypothetical protein
MNSKIRIINSGLTGNFHFTILQSVMGQLSDGKWENTPVMRKYWENAEIRKEGNIVFIIVNDDSYNSGFRGKSEDWIKNWFAGKIKEIVYDELDSQQWDRADQTTLDYFGDSIRPVTVRDAYMAYEILKGRNIAGRY